MHRALRVQREMFGRYIWNLPSERTRQQGCKPLLSHAARWAPRKQPAGWLQVGGDQYQETISSFFVSFLELSTEGRALDEENLRPMIPGWLQGLRALSADRPCSLPGGPAA